MNNPLTINELQWMVVGEKLHEGSVLYRDLWTNTGLFSAVIYWFIDILVGRSQAAYMIIAFFLLFGQSIIFNQILLKNEAFAQPTYVPAIVYGLLGILSFDFMTLSPQLMGATFILLALDVLFSHINNREKKDERIQFMGICLVSATLFYFPYFVFLPGVVLVLIIFTGTAIRRLFLVLYGFALPCALVAIYYWYRDGAMFFFDQFFLKEFHREELSLVNNSSLWVIMAAPLVFVMLGLFKLFGRTRYTNFQISLIQVALILLLFAGLGFWLSPYKPPHALMVFLPLAAFIISHWLMLIKSKFFSELSFLLFVVVIILWNFGTLKKFSPTASWIDYSKLVVTPSKWDTKTEGKRVLILSSNPNPLRNSRLATPFLSWKLSRSVFQNPEYYKNIVLVYKYFKKDPPDFIIDPHGLMGPIFEKIPELKTEYIQTGDHWIKKE